MARCFCHADPAIDELYSIPPINAIRPVPVRSANDMYMATMELVQGNILPSFACRRLYAVEYSDIKIKKGQDATFALLLKRTPDILDAVGHMPGERPFWWALPPKAIMSMPMPSRSASQELRHVVRQRCDEAREWLCGGNQSSHCVFARWRGALPQMSKEDVAGKILDIVSERMSLQ